ncbi:MAG TPA: VOC family protein [Caulobacteraceae bacterium]|jgi:hypothetical protein|nr:VOC family protein [Caulobacteraceae bacterium]
MRLRQVALMAHQIGPVAQALEAVFGLQVAYRDPGVEVFGLANVVMPAGGEFIEVLEPLRPDASGARYLTRRGGDAGYMVILQDEDAPGHRARVTAMGVREIARSDGRRYRFTHFHPSDVAGILLSIDDVVGADWSEPLGDWPPAGPEWRDHPSHVVSGLEAVTVQARDPRAAATRLAEVIGRPMTTLDGGLSIPLDRGVIRFVSPIDEDGTGVVGVDLRCHDPSGAITRAAAARYPLLDGAVLIGGVAFRPVG